MGLDLCQSAQMAHDLRCAGCPVQRIVRSAALPASSFDQVLPRSQTFTLSAKRALYREGDPAEALYALRRGWAKLLRKDENGKPRVVGLLGAGSALGLEAVTRGVHRHTAVAVEPLEFCRVPGAVLRQLRSVAGPGFVDELARHWQAHLDEAESMVVSLGNGTAEQRLARLLLKLAPADGENPCVSLLRSDLGSLLGVSMETASRLMARFRRSGLIDGTRRRPQCDAERLRRAACGSANESS
ncbi:MAG TPA: Crp/Fnr family transcriptional regulator [Ramlibacter sp.]|nr:Crp/Fnr family transcriptional regulator [Ramlibacter sp.]